MGGVILRGVGRGNRGAHRPVPSSLKVALSVSEYQAVFDIRGGHARQTDWAEFVPDMRSKVMRFEVVDQNEWQARQNGMLFPERSVRKS